MVILVVILFSNHWGYFLQSFARNVFFSRLARPVSVPLSYTFAVLLLTRTFSYFTEILYLSSCPDSVFYYIIRFWKIWKLIVLFDPSSTLEYINRLVEICISEIWAWNDVWELYVYEFLGSLIAILLHTFGAVRNVQSLAMDGLKWGSTLGKKPSRIYSSFW